MAQEKVQIAWRQVQVPLSAQRVLPHSELWEQTSPVFFSGTVLVQPARSRAIAIGKKARTSGLDMGGP